MGFVDRIWYDDGLDARATRAMLAPAAALFGAIVRRRNARFDQSTAAGRSRALVPAVSVGNLTVGGTGKTPVSAWCAARLRAQGARPAIVLRGYGDDEPRVHALLNPGVPVVVSPDRTAGNVTARTRGADCVVLDDAFQHRRAHREADLVLVSADSWRGRDRLLPAGPFREPLGALRRASVVVLTVKAADAGRVAALEKAVAAAAPEVPRAVARLVPDELRLVSALPDPTRAPGAARAERAGLLARPVSDLAGRRVGVMTGIGDPAAFEAQLRALGADIVHVARFGDHHAFASQDAARTVGAVAAHQDDAGFIGVVCTLKDAVKLRDLWPRGAPSLWYVSQSVVIERGAEALDRALARVLAARAVAAPTAG